MPTLSLTVLPAKALKDGRNKVRIAVAHNSQTRYIVTDVVIDSPREWKNGQIVRRDDAAYLNTKLRKKLNEVQQSIDEVTAYIDGHYMDADLSLAGVADRFHMSESYLSCLFKAQTGTNFFSYVEDLRIARAKTLLRETNLKINEIAQQSGYASANSFCRAFKRNTGESATNYRNGTFTP